MQTYNNSVVLKFDSGTTGNADSGAPITVRIANAAAGSGALATIYDNQNTQILNPLTTDANGNYSFKAGDGVYDIVVREGQASEYIIQNEKLDESAGAQITTTQLIANTTDFDFSYVVTTSGTVAGGDGGSSSWVQNGVVGQTPEQSPIDLGLNLLNDGNGKQWELVLGQTIQFSGAQYFPLPFGNDGVGPYFYNSTGFQKIVQTESSDWHEIKDKERLNLIAHRGFRDSYPENTMIAFTSAINAGACAVECDVQITSDGIPIVFHDTTVDSLTSGTGAVTSKTLAQIQALTFTSTTGTILAGCRIPAFSDVLNYCKSAGVEIYPEIKGYRTSADISLMLDDIVNSGMELQSFVQSFQIADLEYARTLNKNVSLGLTGSSTTTYEASIDRVSALGGGGFIYWGVSSLLGTPAIVTYAKSKNVDVGAWTVNDADDAKALMKIGVNKIMSDLNIRVL